MKKTTKTTLGQWAKSNKSMAALFSATVTVAIATLVSASTSKQVEELTNPLVVPRTGHAATVLSDGRVFLTGGRDSAGNIVAVSEIFDPATETSTGSATLTTPRVNHTATLLADGKVLVAGGTGTSGALNSAEIFDPANPSNGFQMVGATMGAARSGHTATLLSNGTVLIAGGDTAGTAEIFDPVAGTFSSAVLNLAVPRTGHTATLFSNDNVLLAGGGTNTMEWFTPSPQRFTIDPKTMSASRTGHFALELSDTRLLLFGGDTGNTVDEFNSSADTITLKDSGDAAASSATLLANGKILVIRPDLVGLYSPDATSSAFTALDETLVPGITALQRSGQTATELKSDKKIFVAGGKNAQNLFTGAALFNPVRIWTDKDDYQPGDNVILSGSGWKPNENVYLYAVDDTTQAWTYGSTVTADANGGFVVDPYFIVQLVQLGAHFSVSAVGAQSAMQADVKFTDASIPVTVTSVGGVAAGSPKPLVTYTTLPQNVAVVFNYSTDPTGTSTADVDLVGAGVSVSGVSVPAGTHTGQSITLNIPSGTANGTYNVKVTLHSTAGANNGNDNVNQAVRINVPAIAPTTLTVNPASGTYGGTTTLSATLKKTSDLSPVSGKSVSFTLNGTPVPGSATTDVNGVATLSGVSLSGISAGTYASGVGASFAGDSGYAASSGTAQLTVNKGDTSSSVASNRNPSVFGQSVTFTATVSAVAPGSGTPTGTVDFKDGATTLASGVSLSGGSATFSTSSLSVATHSITAVYNGDSNFSATGTGSSTATALSQVVDKADTSTTIASNHNPLCLRTVSDLHRHGQCGVSRRWHAHGNCGL
jgi:hypothetical protein